MARLLKDRSVARFIVAPTGYGKTSLALDYAETMFSWIHVFWINGQSPCFIRDIDEGTIACDCREADGGVRLVVFDDVPALDGERAERFSAQIDELLGAECEVIVTCTPQCDVYGRLQRDRMRICARELLVSDDEIDAVRNVDERAQLPVDEVAASERIPMLVWREGGDAAQTFVRTSLKEQMPADIMLGMASMFVMRRGMLDDLGEIGLADVESVKELSDDYPHFQCDFESGTFEGPSISAEEVAAGLRGVFDDLVASSKFDTREQLAWTWASFLVEGGDFSRACGVVRGLCSRAKRAAWLASNANMLVEGGCFLEGLVLVDSIRTSLKGIPLEDRAVCFSYEAVCRIVLGDAEGAVRSVRRIAFDETTPLAPRICCLLVIVRYGNELLRTRAGECLEQISASREDLPIELLSPWVQLALSHRYQSMGLEDLAQWWGRLKRAGASRMPLFLTAAWLYSAIAARYAEEGSEYPLLKAKEFILVEQCVRDALSDADGAGYDFYVASAGLALERAHIEGMPLVGGALSARVLLALRQAEMSILAQKTRFERGRGSEGDAVGSAGQRATPRSVVAPNVSGARMRRAVPILKLKMFGRFEVTIGDVVIDDPAFRRKHVRLMLLALTMNSGHDMSRSALAKMLWPNSPEDVAKRNFYTAWSKLRKALTLSDGDCPYLVRHQYGCGLESRYVHSDVARLHEICRELLFGRPNSKSWTSLYNEIDRDYANDLLPSEDDEPFIVQARAECRSRLVDALVSATQCVIDERDYQLAIWFARSAVGHDETREDAYVALMRAQIAASQRTAAMMTYHKCRRVLADKLGVDPSPETVALYETLLDTM